MAASATLDWTNEGVSEQHDGTRLRRTIQQQWHVIDAPERDDVLTTVGLPVVDDPLSPGSAYLVRDRNPRRVGPTTWEVGITYAIPDNGSFGGGDPINPLDRNYRVQWGYRLKNVAKQADYSNRLIKNSAGVFFDPLPETEVVIETLEIRRYEAFYDRAKARLFRNRVNSNTFVVGNTTILPYECKCTYIGPVGEFASNAPHVEISYQFELDIESRATPGESGRPFEFHILDQGTRGWYTTSSKNYLGFFCTFATESGTDYVVTVLDEPVLLDGTGKPIDSTIRVTDKPDGSGRVFTPIANPTSAEYLNTAYESPFSTVSAKVWLYSNLPDADFSQIFA